MPRNRKHTDRLVRLATAYDADTSGPEGEGEDEVTFTLPEDLTDLEDEDLAQLREDAVGAFDALYEQEDPSAEDVEAMNQLADATDAIRSEETRRSEERAANREAAEALASRVRGDDEDEDGDSEDGESEGEATDETDGEPEAQDSSETDSGESTEEEPAQAEDREMVAASSGKRGPISVSLSGIRNRQGGRAPREESTSERTLSLVAGGDLGGAHSAGDEISVEEAASALSRKAQGINESAYRQAFRTGRRLTQTLSVASLSKQIPAELTASADNAMEVLDRAVDEKRLPGGSLVASGGWCSPSETLYDLFSVESSDGLISLPEVGVSRGGIRHTRGPDFRDLFANTGFSFTEADDEEGNYATDGEGNPTEGPKPCYKVECEDFVEDRLAVDGVCITAGILQNRAYPELTTRTTEGALVGHQHRMAGNVVNAMVADSTAVAMPADQVGAFAPLLSAIELQAEHYKYVHRMARATTLEVVLPYWTRGALRSDLSRRLGVPLENVTNAVLGQHLGERGIAPQWIYNYQDLTGEAGDFTAWPSEVRFLLYAAGTWVRGSSDLITLEAVFDSALFTLNDFTALFTEEGWLVARRGHDSREVTVPISATGHTAGGVDIEHDGSAGGGA